MSSPIKKSINHLGSFSEFQPTEQKNPHFKEALNSLNQDHYYNEEADDENQYQMMAKEKENKFKIQLQRSEYSKAEKTKKQLKKLYQMSKRNVRRQLSNEHKREFKLIKKAHQEQMTALNIGWIQIFQKQKQDQEIKIMKLEEERERDLQTYKKEIIRRCQSAKPSKQLAKIQQLQKIQNYLRRQGDSHDLKLLKEEKKLLYKRCEQQHKKLIENIVVQEERKCDDRQTKKYNGMMQSIWESRKVKEREYRREQKRLKKKFKNLASNLAHEQKIQFGKLVKNPEF